MSKENRKMVYDKLVAAGRHKDIDPALMKEFGILPTTKEKPKVDGKPKKVVKKEVK